LKQEEKQLVQTTWKQVVPIADTAAGLFYDRLFELDPGLRPMFEAADMASQRKKLIQALALVVNGLDDPDTVIPRVEELGRRHVDYGVEDRHYDTVGAALLWTLEQGLGERWSDAARDAWSGAYGLVSGVMKTAAARAS